MRAADQCAKLQRLQQPLTQHGDDATIMGVDRQGGKRRVHAAQASVSRKHGGGFAARATPVSVEKHVGQRIVDLEITRFGAKPVEPGGDFGKRERGAEERQRVHQTMVAEFF